MPRRANETHLANLSLTDAEWDFLHVLKVESGCQSIQDLLRLVIVAFAEEGGQELPDGMFERLPYQWPAEARAARHPTPGTSKLPRPRQPRQSLAHTPEPDHPWRATFIPPKKS